MGIDKFLVLFRVCGHAIKLRSNRTHAMTFERELVSCQIIAKLQQHVLRKTKVQRVSGRTGGPRRAVPPGLPSSAERLSRADAITTYRYDYHLRTRAHAEVILPNRRSRAGVSTNRLRESENKNVVNNKYNRLPRLVNIVSEAFSLDGRVTVKTLRRDATYV